MYCHVCGTYTDDRIGRCLNCDKPNSLKPAVIIILFLIGFFIEGCSTSKPVFNKYCFERGHYSYYTSFDKKYGSKHYIRDCDNDTSYLVSIRYYDVYDICERCGQPYHFRVIFDSTKTVIYPPYRSEIQYEVEQ
jgi:hypothetical protein